MLLGVVGFLGPAALRLLSRTWKVTVLGDEHLRALQARGAGHLIALWHGHMLLGLSHHRDRSWSVLVSASRDGGFSNALLRRFGYRAVRGSSGKFGVKEAREALAVLEKGAVLVITPDGPSGPRHSMNPGIAWLARASGSPVVPTGFACDRAWRAKSWDRFTIPKPWARVAVVFESPILPGRVGSDDRQAELVEELRRGILRAEERGAELLGVEPDR